MALTWQWDKRAGFALEPSTDERVEAFKFNLYHGNAYAILIWEASDGSYQLNSFFVDRQHAERCLKDGMYSNATFHLWGKGDATVKLAQTITKYRISVVWHTDEADANKVLETYNAISGV